MKKLLICLLTLTMAFTFAGCGKQEETTEANMVNPVVSYDSLEEINELIGCNLVRPAVMGVSDEAYSVISDSIAQYQFAVNGVSFTFRASKNVEEDISGVYSGDGLLLDSMDEDGYAQDADGKIMQWVYTEGEDSTVYVLYVADGGQMEADTFKSIASEMKYHSIGLVSDEELGLDLYPRIEGEYYDETSGRAMATVTNNGDSVTIVVHWSSSYAEYTQWTMTAKYNSTYGLQYTDCKVENITMNDDGTVQEDEVVSENGAGYFDINTDFNLLWVGAADESCQACVFVKNA